jgi:hypothetical protein
MSLVMLVVDHIRRPEADEGSEYSFRPEITTRGRYTQSRLDHSPPKQLHAYYNNPEITFKPKINPYHGNVNLLP